MSERVRESRRTFSTTMRSEAIEQPIHTVYTYAHTRLKSVQSALQEKEREDDGEVFVNHNVNAHCPFASLFLSLSLSLSHFLSLCLPLHPLFIPTLPCKATCIKKQSKEKEETTQKESVFTGQRCPSSTLTEHSPPPPPLTM